MLTVEQLQSAADKVKERSDTALGFSHAVTPEEFDRLCREKGIDPDLGCGAQCVGLDVEPCVGLDVEPKTIHAVAEKMDPHPLVCAPVALGILVGIQAERDRNGGNA